MSKERELLKTILAYMAAEYLVMTEFEMITQIEDTIKEIQKLLAQPEQEPEAWILEDKKTGYRRQCAYKPTVLFKEAYKVIPLYTDPPKRGRITDNEIYNRCCEMDSSYTCNFIDGVEWAEEQHGIGGGE